MKAITGLTISLIALIATACGGSGAAVSSQGSAPADCSGSCANSSIFLTQSDVATVLSQGIAEAQARGQNATLAVVDRVGNVLAVYRMGAASTRSVLIASQVNAQNQPTLHSGLDGLRLPSPQVALNIDAAAAIAKAITGAYLSSEGNAFSTRTASQIIQEHFNVGEANTPSGPLFGVQFSQLACSDFVQSTVQTPLAPSPGPHNSPLGLSADPGGFPLYKSGTVVGGVGVLADGLYSLDKDISAPDANLDDEAIAYAAAYSYLPAVDRRADEITVNGVTLRYSDVSAANLSSAPGSAPAFNTLDASVGALIPVSGYADGTVHAGTAYTDPSSGVRADTSGAFSGQDAFIFVDGANSPRYPTIAGTDGAAALSQAEVQSILTSALGVAELARAQIRLPVGLNAQVTISVVDSKGTVLGMVRTRDAPIFGADVSLQKARTAALFSSASAGAFLSALPAAGFLVTDVNGYPEMDSSGNLEQAPGPIGAYVSAAQAFLGRPTLLTDGAIAFSDRAIGNISRPFYPDGIENGPNGPFSRPIADWSIFSTGLQLDAAYNAIVQHVLFVASGGKIPDAVPGCAGATAPNLVAASSTVSTPQLANGIQIFPGSVPIYRGGTLVGAVGVSGDGVDQDDMIAFLGLQHAIESLNNSIMQAPASIRADTLEAQGTLLRYVQCPQSPFINSSDETPCAAL
jgi:uncharacterized protein GlcG (DUF336 family)